MKLHPILAGYFGMSDPDARIPWPYNQGDKIIEHEAPITGREAMLGYTSAAEAHRWRTAREGVSNESITWMHCVMLDRVMTDCTAADLLDEIEAMGRPMP